MFPCRCTSKAGQCFQHIIALLHFYCDLLQCCVKVRRVSSGTPNTLGFFSIGNTWSASFTFAALEYVARKVAVDTVSFLLLM